MSKLDTVGTAVASKRVEALGERKFRDIVGILPQPGQLRDNSGTRSKIRDCPGHSGTVGNYDAVISSTPVGSITHA